MTQPIDRDVEEEKTSLPLKLEDFERLFNLQPGERYVYHIGRLDVDKIVDPYVRSLAKEVARLARENPPRLRLAQERDGPPMHEGKVDWKLGEGDFKYIAYGVDHRRK